MFSKRSILGLASLAALALAALGGVAGANHSLYQHLSAGQINGNGASNVSFEGASADGSRVFFATGEQLVSADTDSATDIYERSGGKTNRVSAGQVGGNGAFNSFFAGASADGARVFFQTSEPLVSGDTDSAIDVYERSGGTTTRVSAGAINGNGAFNSFFAGASADGSRVFFETDEKLVPGDTDASRDVYQRAGGRTRRVSAGAINGNGAFGADFEGASTDGARVFFDTDERLVSDDTDTEQDVYQRASGQTTRVSAGAVNGNGAIDAFFRGASVDGTRVFFETDERLVSQDTDAGRDIYQRSGSTTTRISSGNGNFDADFVGASADGARVFFETNESLVGGDTDGGAIDIYQRSGGSTNRISAGQVNGNGFFNADFAGASEDGTRVFFHTLEQLVSADTDAQQDVYERSGGTTKRLSTGAVEGNSAVPTFFQGASADGSRVFFATTEQLVPGDTDASIDVFERAAGETNVISLGNGAFPSNFVGASDNASAVFFQTQEKVFASDQDDAGDIYGAYLAP